MATLGSEIIVLPGIESNLGLMVLAFLMGAAQALIFPSTMALVSSQINRSSLGAGMGLVGTLRNAGKVVGPVLGGFLIEGLDFAGSLHLLGTLLLIAAAIVWSGRRLLPRAWQAAQTDLV
jgi:MFS family permease